MSALPAHLPAGASSAEPAFVIAIANEKGGVAKTTTAISLGAAFAALGQPTLLIDLDAQANLGLGLGIQPPPSRFTSIPTDHYPPARLPTERSIMDVLLDTVEQHPAAGQLHAIRRPTNISNLDIIPASPDLTYLDRLLTTHPASESALRRSLAVPGLSSNSLPYAIVLIDCPPSLGAATTNALVAADLIIAPTQPEYFSAYGLRSLMSLIRRIRSAGENSPALNPSLAYFILITLMDRRNRIHRTIYEQLQATFGDGLLRTFIETDTRLRESTAAGQPITRYAPASRSAGQYTALAQELLPHLADLRRAAASAAA